MSRILDMLQEVEEGYHPLVAILNIAREEESDGRLRLDCHRSIAKYIEAEQKSIEVKSADNAEMFGLRIVIDNEAA